MIFRNDDILTKWRPIHGYNAVGTNSYKIIFARYNITTGFFDFTTKTMARGLYTSQMPILKYNTQEILNEMSKNYAKN